MIKENCAPDYYVSILENIMDYGNSLGEKTPRNAWVPEELKSNGKSDVIYWVGCLSVLPAAGNGDRELKDP